MNRKNHLSVVQKGSGMFVLCLVLASMMLSSCSKSHEEPKLIVSSDTLFFKGNETLSLYVTTDNTERREFYVTCPEYWVSVSPQSGRIVEGDTVELKLTSFIHCCPLKNQNSSLKLL